ncbi:MAG TPA: zinc-binding dehydrogenase, partial [Planctomycetota bacterium]|nr:zinc-binding dehydrogenase [Planctomycetota bacterium]
GIITEIGKGVKGFKVGQPVAMFGTRLYAEYSVRKPEELALLTVGTGLVEAAPLALAGAVIEALKRAPDMKGRVVLITGLGPAGLFLVQLARNAGAGEIIAQDIRPDRFDLAHGLGATTTALANDRDVINRFREEPADLGIDCSGSPQAVSLLYSMCTHVVAFGTVDETVKIDIPRRRFLTLVNGYLTREERCEGLAAAVKLFLKKKLETRPLISQTMLLEEYALAMQKVRRGEVVKLVLTRS